MGSPHSKFKVQFFQPIEEGERISQFGQTVIVEQPCICAHIQDGFTLLDATDMGLLLEFRWNIRRSKRTAYVVYIGRDTRKRFHKEISGESGVDHKNRIGWDNRRSNLRSATENENAANHGPSRGKVHSKFKGVTYDSKKSLFRARIMVEGKSISLGRFKKEGDAAKAYDAAAIKYFGEFAYVNF